MTRPRFVPLGFARLFLLVVAALPGATGCVARTVEAAGDPAALRVSADRDAIHLQLPATPGTPVRVYALAAHEDDAARPTPLFAGPAPDGPLTLARPAGAGAGPDPIYRRFLVTSDTGTPLAPARWVSDVAPATAHPMPWPEGIKGVSNPVDFDDLNALGVKHVHVNFKLPDLFLTPAAPDPGPEFVRTVNGETLRFDPATLAAWDAEVKRMTDDGINVVAVFLNAVPRERPASDHYLAPLIHPDTDLVGAPFSLGAFNLSTERAVAMYTGALGFMAERYSRADRKHGWIGGYIVGNEVDSHWTWHNMGKVGLETLARHHAQEMRLAWLAVRQHHAEPDVWVSLTHSWARPNSNAPLKNCAGKDLLIRLTELSRDGGDYRWGVAYHPYPQNLFQPKFWNDRMAMFGYDSPMITFKNIELLPAYLKRPEMTFDGEPRRVILSEQGFHTPKDKDGETGEDVQAAAFALAQHRIEQTDGIDAFILHRHVDVRGEGGLLLGLRHLIPEGSDETLGAKKRSWDIFRAAETPAFASDAAFALELAGYDGWEDADPQAGPFPEHAPEWDGFQERENVAFDLLKRLSDAKTANTLVVKRRMVGLMDGGIAESLLLHPLDETHPPATATWTLNLPAENPALEFQTYLGTGKGDGVTFRVRVDDTMVFEEDVTEKIVADGLVDLSAFAGKTVRLTLEVGCRASNDHDAAEWLTPAVVTRP